MNWLKLIIESDEAHGEALSDALLERGAGSVTLEDSADQPLFEPPPGETPLWSATRVIALFDAETDPEAVFHTLPAEVSQGAYRIEALEDKDWVRAWMDHFKPMRFGQNLWIVPEAFDIVDESAVNIRLDPGLAFGTGTHPTTALCLEWLDANPPKGKTVVDYGCGSGILALAAAKLGASRVIAVDNDPQALIATRENARVNQVSEQIETYSPDNCPASQNQLVLANILAGPLVDLMATLSALTADGGGLVLSGILRDQADGIREAYGSDFPQLNLATKEDWVRLSGDKPAKP